jgi:hypothetical protein
MTTEQQGHLFDPDQYGPGRKPRAPKLERVEIPLEPLNPGWTYMRDRQGMIPYAHLIGGVSTNGAATTLCGRIGTRITNAGVSQMQRCPGCDIALQLQ